MSSSDRVWVRVSIPHQEYRFDYDPEAWDYAVEDDKIDHLIDADMSDLYVEKEFFGPDGERVYPYGEF